MNRDDDRDPEPVSASPPDLQALLRYLKALADESRLRIVGILATSERSVEELAAMLKLRAPTVSHHLALLRGAGLVTMRPEGNTHIYRLNAAGLGRMNKLLSAPERVAILARDDQGDAWERKVLRDFLEDGRLKQIPARLQKRRIILRWLCDQFEYGRTYTEKEVNQLLADGVLLAGLAERIAGNDATLALVAGAVFVCPESCVTSIRRRQGLS